MTAQSEPDPVTALAAQVDRAAQVDIDDRVDLFEKVDATLAAMLAELDDI